MNSMSPTHPMSRFSTGKIALLVALGTESVFFITLLVAYAALRDQVNWDVPHTLTRLSIPLVNSGILLISAFTAWWTGKTIRKDKQSALKGGLIVTLLLGLVFIGGQIYEFNHAGLSIGDQAFGGVFFTLIGFHAIHVLAGVIFFALNLTRTYLGDFSSTQFESIELGNWFWYYVTAVWAVLFTALYLV